jgi:hypothetical protein
MQPEDREVEWREFKAAFRGHHIPAGIMDRKLNEFLASHVATRGTMPRIAPGISKGRGRMLIRTKARGRRCK